MPQLSESDILLTTVLTPSHGNIEAAIQLAGHLHTTYVHRRKLGIGKLARQHRVRAALVVGPQWLRLVYKGREYEFHPNMTRHRLSSLMAGGADRFIDAAGLRPGDQVLDCTCGLGTDAVIAAHAVAKAGVVQALEASAILAAIVRHGLQAYQSDDEALIAAMRRVTVIHAHAEEYLALQDTNSWDVVYFDPMFPATFTEAKGLDLVRLLASPELPDHAVIAEARRVATRCVVVKDHAPGELLSALNIPVVSDTKRTWYGRVAAFQ